MAVYGRRSGGSGGSLIGWDGIQWPRILSILGSQVDDYQWSPLLNPNDYDVSGGTFAQLAGSTGGVLHAGTGGSTFYFAGQKSAAGSVVPIPNMKTSPWAVAAKARFAATPAGATNEIDVAGMLGSTHFCSVQIDVDTSTSVLQLTQFTSAGTVTRTPFGAQGTIGSGLAVGVWFDVLIANDPAGGRVVASVNGGTPVISTNLTNQSTQACRAFFDTSQASAVDFDAILFAYKTEP